MISVVVRYWNVQKDRKAKTWMRENKKIIIKKKLGQDWFKPFHLTLLSLSCGSRLRLKQTSCEKVNLNLLYDCTYHLFFETIET